jgi:FdhD protein
MDGCPRQDPAYRPATGRAPPRAGPFSLASAATRVRDNRDVPTTIDPHVAVTWIERVGGGSRERTQDEIAIEEPLEIRVDGHAVAVTMRTPGHDEELAAGFLAGEAVIGGPPDLAHVGLTDDLAANTIAVRTTSGLRRDPADERRFHLSSSCGVCGKAALEHVRVALPAAPQPRAPIAPRVVMRLPAESRRVQEAFERTGGLHATALFEAGGELLVLREDVGRHNAMDKAIGSMLLAGRHPLPGVVACLSGRVSFELVQKAVLAGLAGIVAVGAPTSLAIDLAEEAGMFLCGFVRDGSFNVYAGASLVRGT